MSICRANAAGPQQGLQGLIEQSIRSKPSVFICLTQASQLEVLLTKLGGYLPGLLEFESCDLSLERKKLSMRPRLGYSARKRRVSADDFSLSVSKALLTKVCRHGDAQLPTAIGLEFRLGNSSRHTL